MCVSLQLNRKTESTGGKVLIKVRFRDFNSNAVSNASRKVDDHNWSRQRRSLLETRTRTRSVIIVIRSPLGCRDSIHRKNRSFWNFVERIKAKRDKHKILSTHSSIKAVVVDDEHIFPPMHIRFNIKKDHQRQQKRQKAHTQTRLLGIIDKLKKMRRWSVDRQLNLSNGD